MTVVRRHWLLGLAVILALALLVTVSAGPMGLGADHLDAPGLMSPAGNGQADINDVYVFEGANPAHTVLAVTTNPAAGVLSPTTFGEDILYQIRVDNDGDAVADLTYNVTFDGDDDDQEFEVELATGAEASELDDEGEDIAEGETGEIVELDTGGWFFAGLRSDPFFFDLGGFLGTVEDAMNGRLLGDGMATDPFADFDTLAIVIEVPDSALGSTIGVWAVTSEDGVQLDRMGRPAINTVVNSSGPIVGAPSDAKNVYNASDPADDVANFTAGVIAALQAFSSLDTEGAYSDAEAGALAGVLLPDVLTYDTGTPAAGPLNGRALADDVIDIELRIVTGGDPLGLFPGRDADGAINTDGIGPHDDYLSEFPYLGEPNAAPVDDDDDDDDADDDDDDDDDADDADDADDDD